MFGLLFRVRCDKMQTIFFEFCYKEEHCMGPYDTRNMELHEKQGVAYLTFPAFSAVSFVRHAFSTEWEA